MYSKIDFRIIFFNNAITPLNDSEMETHVNETKWRTILKRKLSNIAKNTVIQAVNSAVTREFAASNHSL